jgi:sigma-B regulation protein RsbU (phosphoserine phosphatase)
MSEPFENIFQIGEALEQRLAQLEESLDDQVNKIIDISHIGAAFTSTLQLDMILPMVIETGLKLVRGEVGEVLIFSYNGAPKSVSWGLTTEIIKNVPTDKADDLIELVKQTGEAVMLNDIEYPSSRKEGSRSINLHSIIVVPIKSQHDPIGVISIVNKEDGEEFDSNDKLSLELIGNFAGVAIKNAELHQEALTRQKLEHELQLAEQVQTTLMPEKKIECAKLTVYAYYDVAGQVGGDFYDFIDLGEGRYLVVVADVSNKGVPAALIMTSVRSYVRAAAENTTNLCEIAALINKHLSRDIEKLGSMFVTMFFGLIDTATNKLYSVNAGHPPGIIINKDRFVKLKVGGTFIGQFADLTFTQKECDIISGDRLIIFTDGIFECVNSSGQMLGLENAFKFFKFHRNSSWDEFAADLRKLMIEYSFDQGRVDDTTLLMIEIK